MKYFAVFLFALLSLPTQSASAWFCDEGSSSRRENVFKVCGTGTGETESVAREGALQAALKEFNTLCEASNDCQGHKKSINPKRSECRYRQKQFVCRRMLEIHISNSDAPTSTEEIVGTGWLFHEGQSASDVVKIAGLPDDVTNATTDATDTYQILLYRSSTLCAETTCSFLTYRGRVQKFSGVKPELIGSKIRVPGGFWSELFHNVRIEIK